MPIVRTTRPGHWLGHRGLEIQGGKRLVAQLRECSRSQWGNRRKRADGRRTSRDTSGKQQGSGLGQLDWLGDRFHVFDRSGGLDHDSSKDCRAWWDVLRFAQWTGVIGRTAVEGWIGGVLPSGDGWDRDSWRYCIFGFVRNTLVWSLLWPTSCDCTCCVVNEDVDRVKFVKRRRCSVLTATRFDCMRNAVKEEVRALIPHANVPGHSHCTWENSSDAIVKEFVVGSKVRTLTFGGGFPFCLLGKLDGGGAVAGCWEGTSLTGHSKTMLAQQRFLV